MWIIFGLAYLLCFFCYLEPYFAISDHVDVVLVQHDRWKWRDLKVLRSVVVGRCLCFVDLLWEKAAQVALQRGT